MKYGFIRTAKVRANVYSDGTFRIMSFCKRQEPDVKSYLKKRVAVFTIPKFFFDEGYIELGEQYLQLRYILYPGGEVDDGRTDIRLAGCRRGKEVDTDEFRWERWMKRIE